MTTMKENLSDEPEGLSRWLLAVRGLRVTLQMF